MKRMVDKMMALHGQRLTLVRGGERKEVTGFLQPVTGKAQRQTVIHMTSLGADFPGEYVYVGPAETELSVDDVVESVDGAFLVRNAQILRKGDQALYCWAMCTKKGSEAAWAANG